MKLITKLRKADFHAKTNIWIAANLSNEECKVIVREMILSVPKGCYKLHDRQCGTNLVDTVYEMYGWMPSMFVNEPILLGLQAINEKRVYATFTLGLDAIKIK